MCLFHIIDQHSRCTSRTWVCQGCQNANDPNPQQCGEGMNRLVWAMSDAVRTGIPIASDVQVARLNRAYFRAERKGSLDAVRLVPWTLKVYNEILNRLKTSRNYFSDRCDRWKNIGSASQHRRTINCLDGVTLLQWAMCLRQRTALLSLLAATRLMIAKRAEHSFSRGS